LHDERHEQVQAGLREAEQIEIEIPQVDRENLRSVALRGFGMAWETPLYRYDPVAYALPITCVTGLSRATFSRYF